MMKKVIVWFLILISLAALVLRFSDKWAAIFFGVKPVSGISILSQPSDALVYLDGLEVGKTPYENKDLDVKEYVVKIEKEGAFWQGKVNLFPGTVSVINRDLAKDAMSQAGEILTLSRGKGLTIVSNPPDATVEIDGKAFGNTPVTVNIEKGERTILLSHTNYFKRSIRANLPDDYNLTVAVDLALSEADLTAITTPTLKQSPEVLVKNTPTGFLRVRDKPNLNGKEIAQAKPGETLVLLEEQGAWDRIRLPDGTEGFVSSSYVEKKL